MANTALSAVLTCSLLGHAFFAQPVKAAELIPLIGYSAGGQFEDSHSTGQLTAEESASKGLILAFDDTADKQYELLYSYQSTVLHSDDGLVSTPLLDIDFHYLQLGGNFFFNGRETLSPSSTPSSAPSLSPYIAGGLGLTLIDPRVTDGKQQLRPSMNLAFGVSWMATPQFGLRAELRGYGTLMDNTTFIACNGGCSIKVSGDMLVQYQLNTGLIFRF